MATQSELKELNDYIDGLVGDAWKQLARIRYRLSRQEGKPHQSAMEDTYNVITELANKITKGEQA
jgi:hypothetical protein